MQFVARDQSANGLFEEERNKALLRRGQTHNDVSVDKKPMESATVPVKFKDRTSLLGFCEQMRGGPHVRLTHSRTILESAQAITLTAWFMVVF
jgi:hypothetical protein